MSEHRLPTRPGEVIDRMAPVWFTWNGDRLEGLTGDTIVSALAANGVRTMSRSFKYHRRRGILTASYHDPNTIVQVGAEPNVRAGHRRLAAGMEVRSQNTWPSLDLDVKSANRFLSRFLPPGFYYKTFMGPRPLWPLYQRVLGRFAAGGVVDPDAAAGRFDHRYAHPDVLVAGGGPAGMAAAVAAAATGASVMLVEEEPELGGHLRWGSDQDLADLARLRAEVAALPDIEVLVDSVVNGRYDHNWVAVVQRNAPGVDERLIKARAKSLVVAAGTIERPYVFAGNDLPGVMLSTAVRRLLNLYAVKPGERAVVVTANASGDAAAADLELAGVEIARILDSRRGETIVSAVGKKQVTGVVDSSGRHTDADLVVTATGWTTPTSLLNMAGDHPFYHAGAARFLPGALPDDVMAAGGMLGDGSTEQLIANGAGVGREAARRALAIKAARQAATPAAAAPSPSATTPVVVPDLDPGEHPQLFRASTHGFVDFSEDVTSADLFAAAAEGYDSIELAKRYTTATMGPIQGKLESINALAVHGEAIGADLLAAATTTWRPPYAPIRLGTLAGRPHDPVRYSPMQTWHDDHGASRLIAGQWIRPDHYGDPRAEVRAVREGVGIIDVSPLGKIDLRGRDVAKLLDFVYVNKWAGLDVGKVRYGVMCSEDGVIFDDGVTGRLGPEHYMMTTTSGGAGTVWNWLDDWLQTGFPEWDVRMTAVTDGVSSINVAGPRSRELVARLTDIDLDPVAFPHMNIRVGTVAGVADCIVWRIAFTGELSYEIHVPSGYALWVWEQLIDQGADLGVRPFGIEAQRIMRLEKGHFIVGQDTDGLTQGFGVGFDRAIRLDKDDFAGRPELAWQADSDTHRRLVALQTDDPSVVPPEASQIIEPTGSIKGRITSSRWSPTLDRSICLAQLDPDLAASGTFVTIRLPEGGDIGARVMEHLAHFDHEGSRLRV